MVTTPIPATAPVMPATRPVERPTTASGRVIVTYERLVSPEIAEILWHDYEATFQPLLELALLNHLYERRDFDALLSDPRVVKLIGWRNGVPLGLAMVTNCLEIVPQISPAFLRRRYPVQCQQNSVFFAILMFVTSTARARTLFARLAGGAAQLAAEKHGVLIYDVCQHNVDELGLVDQIESVGRWFPNSSQRRIDSQHYYAVSFEAPADDHRFVPRTAPSTMVVHQKGTDPAASPLEEEVGMGRLPGNIEPCVLAPTVLVPSNRHRR